MSGLYPDQSTYTLACSVCNNSDYTCFDYNGDSDSCTCMVCGAILESMGFVDLMACSVQPLPMEVSLAESTPAPKPAAPFKGTYNRRAYFSERLSAACLLEPDIPEADKAKIRSEYEKYADKDWIQRERRKKGSIHKRDIQQILRSLNKANNTNRFTTGYLGRLKPLLVLTKAEKWKSIKAMLGGKVKVYTPEQLAKVGSRLMQYSGQWDYDQPPGDKHERTHWHFKRRKDFPNFNYMVRLVHRQLGIRGLDGDFPIPTTPNSVKQLKEFATYLEPSLQPKTKQSSIVDFLKDYVIELKTKWTNFLQFLVESGPGMLRSAENSPIYKGLHYPDLSLSVFMDNIKKCRHFQPDIMNMIHETADRWNQCPEKERMIFVDHLDSLLAASGQGQLLGMNTTDSQQATIMQGELVLWARECPDHGTVHKFCRYLDFFDSVADHSICCKPVDLTRSKKPSRKAKAKKT